MPLTSANGTAAIAAGLASVTMTGTEVTTYARGIATGISNWLSAIRVTTVDVGTTGVGNNVPLPVVIPSPVLYSNLIAGFAAQALTGTSVPSLCLGLSTGISGAFAQALIVTQHPTVGVGTGVAKFVFSTSIPFLLGGFAQAGMKGTAYVTNATAIGIGLDLTLASLTYPIAIVGASSPYAGAGIGSGSIV